MRLFLPPEQFTGGTAQITDVDHQHLVRVMRARVGESITLLDNCGHAYHATLTQIEKHTATARLDHAITLHSEPALSIAVGQALGKGDKFEQVLQHGTEVGVSIFIPLQAERSVVDIPPAKLATRLQRWQMIAKGAAEQSGRLSIPQVLSPMTLAQFWKWCEEQKAQAILLTPAPSAQSLFAFLTESANPQASFAIAVGPEGGWSSAEVLCTQKAKLPCVCLGERVLRTETTALVTVSQILYHFEHFTPA
ncbi:ribosomal RNA small subunit methyltransferase E [Armatimonadota bacterium]|nr:ribosomal RNA small subunit methyltransferase E [Armatimonadota bacterium]